MEPARGRGLGARGHDQASLTLLPLLPTVLLLACQPRISGTVTYDTGLAGRYPAPLLVSANADLDGVQLVDSRSAEDFAQGHVPGAINVPWRELRRFDDDGTWTDDEDRAAAALLAEKGLKAELPVVLYDDWATSWGGEGFLYWSLRHLGATELRVLDGGWGAWLATGHHGVSEQASQGDFTLGAGPRNFASTEDVAAAVTAGDTVLLDVRSRAEFLAGHIPGAVHLPYDRMAWPDGRMRPPEDIQALLQEAGAGDPSTPIITYCARGIRAGHTYFVLELMGYQDVRDYIGSWEAWTAADGDVDYGR